MPQMNTVDREIKQSKTFEDELIKEIERLHEKVEKLKKENVKLSKNSDKPATSSSELLQDVKILTLERDDLLIRLQNCRIELTKVKEEKKLLLDENRDMIATNTSVSFNSEMEKLKERILKFESENSEQKMIVKELESMNKKLNSERKELDDTLKKLKNEQLIKVNEIETLISWKEDQEKKLSRLQDLLKKRDNEIEKLTDEVLHEQKARSDQEINFQCEIEKLKEEIQNISERNERTIKEMQEKHEKMVKSHENQLKEQKSLEEELRTCLEQKDQLNLQLEEENTQKLHQIMILKGQLDGQKLNVDSLVSDSSVVETFVDSDSSVVETFVDSDSNVVNSDSNVVETVVNRDSYVVETLVDSDADVIAKQSSEEMSKTQIDGELTKDDENTVIQTSSKRGRRRKVVASALPAVATESGDNIESRKADLETAVTEEVEVPLTEDKIVKSNKMRKDAAATDELVRKTTRTKRQDAKVASSIFPDQTNDQNYEFNQDEAISSETKALKKGSSTEIMSTSARKRQRKTKTVSSLPINEVDSSHDMVTNNEEQDKENTDLEPNVPGIKRKGKETKRKALSVQQETWEVSDLATDISLAPHDTDAMKQSPRKSQRRPAGRRKKVETSNDDEHTILGTSSKSTGLNRGRRRKVADPPLPAVATENENLSSDLITNNKVEEKENKDSEPNIPGISGNGKETISEALTMLQETEQMSDLATDISHDIDTTRPSQPRKSQRKPGGRRKKVKESTNDDEKTVVQTSSKTSGSKRGRRRKAAVLPMPAATEIGYNIETQKADVEAIVTKEIELLSLSVTSDEDVKRNKVSKDPAATNLPGRMITRKRQQKGKGEDLAADLSLASNDTDTLKPSPRKSRRTPRKKKSVELQPPEVPEMNSELPLATSRKRKGKQVHLKLSEVKEEL